MNRNYRIRLIVLCFLLEFHLTALRSQSKLNIVDKTVSFGMRQTFNRNICAIIVHSTYNNSGGEKYDIDLIIKQFSHYHVSSHYVIGREGTIYQLVKEKNVSFQAGKSSLPDGRKGVNSCSIGIELVNANDDSPTEAQIRSLTILIKNIQSRYNIKYILRHSDIAPDRKTDPWNMNWEDFMQRLKN
ncbi:MAG: N-acetylmuramoyl-L-alanine amidase [Bacteroidota bacterium]|nr:N-acetylmuramoyl-L-alanine amidase [Bacteroidota bacterium]